MPYGQTYRHTTRGYAKRGSGYNRGNGSYKGISAGYKRPRSAYPTQRAGLAAAVKKINIKSTPEKHVSKCFVECPLFHNLWNKGDYASQAEIPAVAGVAAVAADAAAGTAATLAVQGRMRVPAIIGATGQNEDLLVKMIESGTSVHQRSTPEVYVSRMTLRMLFSSARGSHCNTFRVVVYMTPRDAPGSSGPPLQFYDGSSAQYNNLLRTIDSRGAHILHERIYTPPSSSTQASANQQTSFMSTINVKIGRSVTFLDPTHVFGKNGSWGNLHIAVLAYDHATLSDMIAGAENTFVTEDRMYGDNTMGIGETPQAQFIRSGFPIGSIGMETCIYFKDL